jgi:hypothetical protein
MKILLYVPLWNRPEIVEIFLNNMERVRCQYAEVIPYFVISPEDEKSYELMTLTDGYYKTFVTNDPFGRKKNEGLMRALSLKWDYLMELNSDTVFTSLLWDYLSPYLNENAAAFGFKNIYIYEPVLNKAVFNEGYHIGHRDTVTALGPGRCIRRDVVEHCLPLWEDGAPFGMDGYSDQRLYDNGYEVTVIDNGRDPVLCDVKGTVCLTCWMQWEECGEPVDVDFVKQSFALGAGCLDLSDFDKFHSAVMRASSEMNRPEAFNLINEAYKIQTGEQRYSSYESYQVTVSRKFKRQ